MANSFPHKATFRVENELLLCCARAHLDPHTERRIRGLLGQELNWKYLIDAATAHGVKPLLSQNLSASFSGAVPTLIVSQLRRYLQLHALNNLFLTRELIRLLGRLEQNGISAIPWKGPVLAATTYGDVALRQFGDLDILVRESDVRRAKELLLSLGYRLMNQVPGSQEEAFHNARKVYELIRDDARVAVELHWAITSRTFPFRLDLGPLWENSETVSLEGARVRNLSPEDLLLVLCVHGSKHHWGKLMWISDIAELLRTYSDRIDWRRLMGRARVLGGGRMLSLGLILARDLLGAKIPADVEPSTKCATLAFLSADVQSGLFNGASLMAVERPNFYVHLRERAGDRLRCRLYLVYRRLSPTAQMRTLRLLHSARSVRHLFLRTTARF